MGVNQRSLVTMTDSEVDEFLRGRRNMTMATMGPGGRIQLVAMWYGFLDGDIAFETKAKSQKVLNLRRDPRLSVLVEDGEAYGELRGVELSGTAELIEDPDRLWQIGVSVFERYFEPYTDDSKPLVENILRKRLGVRLQVETVVSWDHRHLPAAARDPLRPS